MAYLVFSTSNGKELGSRRLDGPLTIGRSPECDVSLHDILLSRNHCKLERTRDGWVVTDLGSKNGTVIDGRAVTKHTLRVGEVIKIGRVNVTFRPGKLAPNEEKKERLTRPKRPADPFNASEGTVAGFKYESPTGERSFENFPTPKPVLTDSGRFVAADVLAEAERAPAATTQARETSPMDSTIMMTSIPRSARPKTPSIDLDASALPAAPAAALPEPPRAPVRLRLRHLVHSLGRGLRRPLARWAALLT